MKNGYRIIHDTQLVRYPGEKGTTAYAKQPNILVKGIGTEEFPKIGTGLTLKITDEDTRTNLNKLGFPYSHVLFRIDSELVEKLPEDGSYTNTRIAKVISKASSTSFKKLRLLEEQLIQDPTQTFKVHEGFFYHGLKFHVTPKNLGHFIECAMAYGYAPKENSKIALPDRTFGYINRSLPTDVVLITYLKKDSKTVAVGRGRELADSRNFWHGSRFISDMAGIIETSGKYQDAFLFHMLFAPPVLRPRGRRGLQERESFIPYAPYNDNKIILATKDRVKEALKSNAEFLENNKDLLESEPVPFELEKA